MSIADKLNKIQNIKEEIKNALIYKGLTVTDLFDTYPEHIRNLAVLDILIEYPFLKIGYLNLEEMPWINKLVEESLEVINNWDKEATVFKGQNIWFFPVVDTSKATTATKAFENMTNLKSIGLINTVNMTDMSYMFYGCDHLFTIPKFHTNNVTNMSYMFYSCNDLEYVPLLDLSSLTNASYMFSYSGIKEFPLFLNTGNITNMANMFYGCNDLESAYVSAWDTSSVTDMANMFYGCKHLKEIDFTGCDLSNVTNFDNIIDDTSSCSVEMINFTNAKIGNDFDFYYFKYVDNLIYNNLDATKATDIGGWFSGCTNITDVDLSTIIFGNVIYMNQMFYKCTNLKSINFGSLNTEFVTNMSLAFYQCDNLDTLDLSQFNTQSLENIYNLFYSSNINTLILDGWDFSNVTSNNYWYRTDSLNNLSLKNVIAKGDFTCPLASESIDLTGIDTTACTSFSLNGCKASTIDVSSLNTSNFTSMSSMFSGCSNVTSLDLSNFDFSNVTTTYSMFNECNSLKTITLRGHNKINSMNYMFYGCDNLISVDMSEFDLDSLTTAGSMFYDCTNLKEVKMGGNPANLTTVSNMFYGITTTGVFYYNPSYDYLFIIDLIPASWDALPLYTPVECTQLVIEASDVRWNETTTTIRYTATTNGYNPNTGEAMNGVVLTGEAQSNTFYTNETDEDITRNISYTYLGVTATTTIILRAYTPYTINLNNQWLLSTEVENPDPTLYDGVYESFSNYNVHSANADCIITIDGLTNFDIYVRSNAEGTYDFVQVFELDSTTTVKASTSGKQNSGTTIDSYTKVSFTNIDGGVHTILVRYKKDSSDNSGTDKGYILIPKNQ